MPSEDRIVRELQRMNNTIGVLSERMAKVETHLERQDEDRARIAALELQLAETRTDLAKRVDEVESELDQARGAIGLLKWAVGGGLFALAGLAIAAVRGAFPG